MTQRVVRLLHISSYVPASHALLVNYASSPSLRQKRTTVATVTLPRRMGKANLSQKHRNGTRVVGQCFALKFAIVAFHSRGLDYHQNIGAPPFPRSPIISQNNVPRCKLSQATLVLYRKNSDSWVQCCVVRVAYSSSKLRCLFFCFSKG